MAKEKDSEYLFMQMDVYTKENGKMTEETVGVLRFLAMDLLILDFFWKIKLMVKDCTLGKTVRFTKESGMMVLKTDSVFGKIQMVSNTVESGKMAT